MSLTSCRRPRLARRRADEPRRRWRRARRRRPAPRRRWWRCPRRDRRRAPTPLPAGRGRRRRRAQPPPQRRQFAMSQLEVSGDRFAAQGAQLGARRLDQERRRARRRSWWWSWRRRRRRHRRSPQQAGWRRRRPGLAGASRPRAAAAAARRRWRGRRGRRTLADKSRGEARARGQDSGGATWARSSTSMRGGGRRRGRRRRRTRRGAPRGKPKTAATRSCSGIRLRRRQRILSKTSPTMRRPTAPTSSPGARRGGGACRASCRRRAGRRRARRGWAPPRRRARTASTACRRGRGRRRRLRRRRRVTEELRRVAQRNCAQQCNRIARPELRARIARTADRVEAHRRDVERVREHPALRRDHGDREQDRHEAEVAELAVEHRRDRLQRALRHRLGDGLGEEARGADASRIETQNGSVPSCWSTPPPWSERRPHLRIARRMNGRSSDSR